jgi:hypothetical protein
MEYVTTILDQLAGPVEHSRLRPEAFHQADGIPGPVHLLRSVDQLQDNQDRISRTRAPHQWVRADPLHEPVDMTMPAPQAAATPQRRTIGQVELNSVGTDFNSGAGRLCPAQMGEISPIMVAWGLGPCLSGNPQVRTPMKWKYILVSIPVLLLGAGIFSTADASPAAGDIAWPLSLITRPCVSITLLGPGSGPPRVVCVGVTGRTATVDVPTAWLSDRAPELSLVSIPTFFNLEWDPQSAGAHDSQPLTISYPIGNPTDKLVDVRVQVRLRAADAIGSPSESLLLIENVALETPDSLFLVDAEDKDSPAYEYACSVQSNPPNQSLRSNQLLTVNDKQGGYKAGCTTIEGLLEGIRSDFPYGLTSPLFDAGESYYMDWRPLSMSHFLAFTPFASIYGAGTDHGSPAFQISATTRFTVEARVVWDEHQEKKETITTDCQWSYEDDYDFIDWSNWPDPIYCRNVVVVTWPVFCEPFKGDCAYGHPNDWWIPYVPALDVQAIRRPDGTYGTTYDFVSVQSQALLSTP